MFSANLFGTIRRWQNSQQARRSLYALKDAQLRDIGITRDDIDAVARGTSRASLGNKF